MFGRLTRIAIDLVAITTILAGVKRSTGYSLKTGRIKDTGLRGLLDSYLGLGENVFAFLCGVAVSSSHFQRNLDD